jgi:cysteinyl-tRNA synthetase
MVQIVHARTYATNDIVQRVLIHMGYNVFTVMNVTNIDDKILKKSNECGISRW